MKHLIWFFMVFLNSALADDAWICKEESSIRRGHEIAACGIGRGKTEAEARLSAFDQAKAEFDRICALSADCMGRRIVVTPARTTCAANDDFKCYRMVVFAIQDKAALPPPPDELEAYAGDREIDISSN